MSYEFYKVCHLTGLIMVFMALGALLLSPSPHWRKKAAATHGGGLLIVLVTGFGLIAKLQAGFPLWVFVKLIIWLVLGSAIVVSKRFPKYSQQLWLLLIAIGLLASYIAVYKPT